MYTCATNDNCGIVQTVRALVHSPRRQVQSRSEAPEDLDFGLGPQAADGVPDAADDGEARRVLLRRRHHELEEVLHLLVQPANAMSKKNVMLLTGKFSTGEYNKTTD